MPPPQPMGVKHCRNRTPVKVAFAPLVNTPPPPRPDWLSRMVESETCRVLACAQ